MSRKNNKQTLTSFVCFITYNMGAGCVCYLLDGFLAIPYLWIITRYLRPLSL